MTELRCMGCNGYGTVFTNANAGDWDWPYACNYCDADRLPDHLRHPTKRAGYVPPPPSRWVRIRRWARGLIGRYTAKDKSPTPA